MLKDKLARTKAQVTFYARNPRLAVTAATTAAVLGSAAFAQEATTMISTSDVGNAKTSWLAGGAALMGTIMGVYGIKLAADYGMRRLGRAAK